MNKRVLAICMVFLLFVVTFNTINYKENDVEAEELSIAAIVSSNVNFRTGPGTNNDIIKDSDGLGIMLQAGHNVTIIGREHTSSGWLWYKITTTYKNVVYTGYVAGEYLKFDVNSNIPIDQTFEDYMNAQGFPESYKPYLRILKYMHPNWNFVADVRDLEWATLLENEYNRPGNVKNTIQYLGDYSVLSKDVNYDATNNKWYVVDGVNKEGQAAAWGQWYATTDEIVSYNLEPRNYLDETHIFAFECLSYNSEVHNIEGVKNILSGTFMEGDNVAFNDPNGKTYAELMMQAADASGVSPYHIASRIRLEMGATPGRAATGGNVNGNIGDLNGDGKISIVDIVLVQRLIVELDALNEQNTKLADVNGDGKVSVFDIVLMQRHVVGLDTLSVSGDNGAYNGIYNYYNIGATDDGNGNATLNGLRWASGLDKNGNLAYTSYGRPWNSVEKSIVGGAQFLNNSYIGVGQDTLYTQKFDLVNFNHQYCTNVQMPSIESISSYKAYAKMGVLDSPFVFKIPVYKNMP